MFEALESHVSKEQYRAFAIKTVDLVLILGRVKAKTIIMVIHSIPAESLVFRTV